MRKKLNLYALTFLLIGQVLLGPMQSMSVYADENVEAVSTNQADEEAAAAAKEQAEADAAAAKEQADADEAAAAQEQADADEAAAKEQAEADAAAAAKEETDANDEEDLNQEEKPVEDSMSLPEEISDDDEMSLMGKPGKDCPGNSCRDITVKKVDPKGNPIQGVTFRTTHPGNQQQNQPREGTTNAQGIAELYKVHNGQTTLSEVPISGYTFCSATGQSGEIYNSSTFTFQTNNDYSFTFVNAPDGMNCDGTPIVGNDGSIIITKEFQVEYGKNDWQLGNSNLTATFELLDENNNSFNPQKIQTTGSDGITTFDGLEVEKTYFIKEVSTSDNTYTLDDRFDGTKNGISVTVGDKVRPILVQNHKMKPTLAELTVKKVFEGLKHGSLQAEFTLTGPNGQVQTATINSNRSYTFTGLGDGHYTLVETSTANGYLTAPDQTFEITNGKFTNEDSKKQIQITNKKFTPVKVKVEKKFEDGKTKYLKAQFTLVCPNYESTQWTDKNGDITFADVPQNADCTLTEVGTPSGYQTIDPMTFNSGKYGMTHKITNKKFIPVKVKVEKSFEGGTTKKLKAKFTLVCPNYESTQWTDKYGNITFADVPQSADCTLTEVDTPTGYQTIDPMTFNSGKYGMKHKIFNKKKTKAELTVTKTFEGSDDTSLQATFTLTGPGPDGEVREGTINNTGSHTFWNLVDGVYTLAESSTATGYQTVVDQTIVIADGKFTNGESAITIDVVNKKNRGGTLIIKKIDGKHKLRLNGAEFELYLEGTLIDTQTTKGLGIARFKGLEVGKTYTLKETKAPNGYDMSDEYATGVPITIELDSNHEMKLTVENTKKGAVTLIKYETGLEAKVLEGAKFKLQIKLPVLGWQDVPGYGNLKTDENGQINIGTLVWGTYRFVETEAPEGYEIGDTNKYPFTITKVFGDTVMVNAYNTPIEEPTGSVSFYKLDWSTELGLGDAKFKLSQCEDLALNKGFGCEEIRNDIVSSSDESNLGSVYVGGLSPGFYCIEETEAPAGYQKGNDFIRCFTIYDSSTDDSSTPMLAPVFEYEQLAPIWNYPIVEPTGSVTLVKHAAGNLENVLGGAVFNLYKRDAVTGDYALFKAGLETTAGGVLTASNLEPGEYYFIETKAPTGYVLDGVTKYFFTVLDDGTVYISGSAGMITVPNKPIDPGTPTVPVIPTDPGTPTVPGTPTDPGTPTVPETPTNPGTPTDPGTPVDPVDPTDPTDPGTPVDPVDPTDPTDPATPVDPVDPIDPTDPSTPVDPVDPVDDGTVIPAKAEPKNPAKFTEITKALTYGKVLPRTGEGRSTPLLVSGLLAALLGGWLLFSRNRKESHIINK